MNRKTIIASVFLSASTALAEESPPSKITYLSCTRRWGDDAVDSKGRKPEPEFTSLAFTDTDVFADAVDKDSVKIDPNSINWTETKGTWRNSLSRVTGILEFSRADSPPGENITYYMCVHVEKPKF